MACISRIVYRVVKIPGIPIETVVKVLVVDSPLMVPPIENPPYLVFIALQPLAIEIMIALVVRYVPF